MPSWLSWDRTTTAKSNVLSALEFSLSTSVKPTAEDLCVHREAGDDALWVELTCHELTEQERNTFKRYVLSDNTVCIRKTASIRGDVEVVYNGTVEQPEQEWLIADTAGIYASRSKVSETPLRDYVPQEGRITKAQIEEAQQRYIEEHRADLVFARTLETGPLLGQKNVAGGILPDFVFIPAVRDLSEEIKLKTTTAFGRLMNRAIREMAERDPRFVEARTQLDDVIASLNERGGEGEPNRIEALETGIEEELKAWGVRVRIEVTPPEVEKLFELGTGIHLDDGVRTTAERKGHGLQRAMVFALLRSWATALRLERSDDSGGGVTSRKHSDSVIFAMEEPELFLHPHAQRRLSGALRQIAETPEHQVFLCTHSTHFVDLEYYKEVAIISKEDPAVGSRVRQCTDELFAGNGVEERKRRFRMAHWINPDRGEMFFARRVVFVEGDTEQVALPYVAQRLNQFDSDISVVNCGSKGNLALYILIAKAFQIPHLVVHDEDPVPAECSPEKREGRERIFGLNNVLNDLVEAPLGRIEMVRPDFEAAAGIPQAQGDRKGKPLAALEYLESVGDEQIPEALRRIVASAYTQE